MRALDRKLARDLWHLKGQVAAIVAVMACGVASYVTMRAMFHHLAEAQAGYYAQYRFADVFASLTRAPATVAADLARVAGVNAVLTRVVADVVLDVPGLGEPATGRLLSAPPPGGQALNDLFLRTGRRVAAGRRDEVIVSEAFAEANGLAPGSRISAVVGGRWQALHVVGVALSPEFIYEIRGGADLFPDNRRFGVLWADHEALATAFDMRGGFNDVAVTLAPGARLPDVIAGIDRVLAPYGGRGAFGRSDQVSHRFITDEIAQARVSATVTPMILLGVAAFLLHVVLSRLVALEREQIGMLKAFGYGRARVAWHYVKLALAPLAAGAVVGGLVGAWLAHLLAGVYVRFYRFPALGDSLPPAVIVGAVGLTILTAAAGAWLAVARIAQLLPAESMRPDAPARFGPGILERLGLSRRLSPPLRIGLRHIERRPVRAGLSVIGIALASAIVIVGRFGFDAIGLLTDVQFRQVQRQDVTVAFERPRPQAIGRSLAQLPGVTRSETYRLVPVRMRHGHLERRVAILGLSPDTTLRRLLDRDRRPRQVPAHGVMLEDRLARILDVGLGDTVTIEAMEGTRPVRTVAVAALVNEMLGLPAYMDLAQLNRLLGEDRVVSGAWLAVEAASQAQLYATLKRLPAVSAVSVRAATVEAFERTVAESFLISVTTLIVFAAVIAAGLVYNTARIALSERGRELASLRVLGFSRREVAVMLFVEQGVLTLAALPLGSLVGVGLSALLAMSLDTELFRIPLVVTNAAHGLGAAVVVVAAIASGALVRRRLDHLDLVEVLKTRE